MVYLPLCEWWYTPSSYITPLEVQHRSYMSVELGYTLLLPMLPVYIWTWNILIKGKHHIKAILTAWSLYVWQQILGEAEQNNTINERLIVKIVITLRKFIVFSSLNIWKIGYTGCYYVLHFFHNTQKTHHQRFTWESSRGILHFSCDLYLNTSSSQVYRYYSMANCEKRFCSKHLSSLIGIV